MLLLSSDSLLREFTRYKLTAMTNITQLLKEFERIAYGQSLHSAFTDLLDWTLLPFKMHGTQKLNKKHSKPTEATQKQSNLLPYYRSLEIAQRTLQTHWENYINKRFPVDTTVNFGP